MKSKPKYRVSLVGGLGNQLFQYTQIRSLHPNDRIGIYLDLDKSKNTILSKPYILDFSIDNYELLSSPKFARWFASKLHNVFLRFSNSKELLGGYAQIGKAMQEILGAIIKVTTLNKLGVNCQYSLGYDEKYAEGNSQINLQIGYFQHAYWAENDSTTRMLYCLRLKNPSSKFYETAKMLKSGRFMVVHFRLGDYLQEKKFGIVKEDYFINAINLLSKKYDYEKIVLFTNDKNEALERFAKIKDKNLVVISEDYGLTPSENLELMRLGSGYVLSNSTFGWWGAFLSHNSNPPVVCPRPWFKGYDEPKHLIPSNWIRIDTD